MTISSTVRIAGPYIGSGAATVFPFAFKVFAAAEMQVAKLNTTSNVEIILVLNTDYTVTLNGDQNGTPGGTITLPAVLASGYNLTITSDIANLQPTDLTNQGGFYPEVITDALDRATIQIQQLDQNSRAIKIPLSDGVLDMTTPVVAERASKYLAFDAAGLPVVSAGTGSDSALRTDLAVASAVSAGSRLSGFRQTGTGATARTVDAKLKDTVSVKDFGAVGDGVTDDTAAIQAAITAGANKEVYFPSGTYVATTLTVANPCRLFGSGIILKTTAAASTLLTINSNDVDIDGLEFRGSSYNATPSLVYNDKAIQINGATSVSPYKRFNLTNLKINGFSGYAIRAQYSEDVAVHNCAIKYCGYIGILYESVVRGSITNNLIQFIDFVGSTPLVSNAYGLSLSRDPTQTLANAAQTQSVVVANNVVSDVPAWSGIDGHAPLNCTITGNVVSRCSNGIYVQYDSSTLTYRMPSNNIIMSNNIVIGPTDPTTCGLGIASLGTTTAGYNENITIENNLLINTGSYSGVSGAVSMRYSKNSVIRNNTIYKAVGCALSFTTFGNVNSIIENNVCNGVKVGSFGVGALFARVHQSNTGCMFRGNRFSNTTGDATYNADVGILYHTANSGTVFSKNRIDSSSLTASQRFIEDDYFQPNRYTNLKWELETESCAPFTHAAVGGAPRETTASQLANFRRLPATGVSSIYTIQYVRASYTSTNTTFKIAVRPKETTIYDVGVYTVDGTNIAAAASITDIYIAIDGIYFND